MQDIQISMHPYNNAIIMHVQHWIERCKTYLFAKMQGVDGCYPWKFCTDQLCCMIEEIFVGLYCRWTCSALLDIILPNGNLSLFAASTTAIGNATPKITMVCKHWPGRTAHGIEEYTCVSGRETRLHSGCNLHVLFLG